MNGEQDADLVGDTRQAGAVLDHVRMIDADWQRMERALRATLAGDATAAEINAAMPDCQRMFTLMSLAFAPTNAETKAEYMRLLRDHLELLRARAVAEVVRFAVNFQRLKARL
ncbi:MAG: hypothetical protein NTX56_05295 [Proteobacteria bacterium]|nr:hypothetical protein [Pseudomonadota bacterium]